MTPKSLRELGDNLFSKRGSYMSLLQEIAEQFYPERADFTVNRTLGEDYAAHLTSSYPMLMRRDLGDQIGTMLRPTNKHWFHMVPRDTGITDNGSKRWLEWAEGVQRRAMYDVDALFNKATKQGDHDFAAFGGFPMSIELSRNRSHLLYRTWHNKDFAYREDQDGKIDFKARRWRPAVSDLIAQFPKADMDPKLLAKAKKDPFGEANVVHIVCAAELADMNAAGRPRVSLYYDADHDRVIEQTPIWGQHYIVPRWQTVAGSQYPFSPAATAGLPEARLLQAMTLTLLEAGEKSVNPPLVATKDVVKSDMQMWAGGVTWVDMEYDEKLGAALRALNIDVKGLPISLQMVQDSRSVLQQCFYLNKLRAFNPNTDPQMTAFQAGQIVQEYIRGALPLFEPMEAEYNGAICEETFDVMFRAAAFGSVFDIPAPLRNADVEFKFESPLHDAIEQQKGVKFLEYAQLIAQAVTLDPAVAHLPDAVTILRDVATGIRVPAKWNRTELQVEEAKVAAAQAAEAQRTLQTLQQGADVAATLGGARKDLTQANATQ